MWRDRTNLYISYRQSYAHHPAKRSRLTPAPHDFSVSNDEDRRGLLSGAADDGGGGGNQDNAVIEMDHLPPRWADVSDEVQENLAEITRRSAKLDKLHAKHVLPGFEDNRSSEEREIDKLTTDITALFHDCQKAIKRVERLARGGSRAEEVMSRNIQVSLATKVQESSALFRKKQAAYLKKLRGLSGKTPPLERSASPHPQFSSTNLMDEENDVSYSQSALQQSATLTSNDDAIMQREREITDIAKGILELADIFRDLQSMVIDQGTLLDRIDYNVENMTSNVKEADKELVVASGYQRRTQKRKLMLLLILLIAGLVIVLSVKPRRGSSSGNKEPTKGTPPENVNLPTPPAVKPDAAMGVPGDPNINPNIEKRYLIRGLRPL